VTTVPLKQLTEVDLLYNINRLRREQDPEKKAAEIFQLSVLRDVLLAIGARTVGEAMKHPQFEEESRLRLARMKTEAAPR
jgi:hypothetical protein